MIDIHCHILPGIDDGAKNLADSVQMAQAAAKEGIHTIIATPHFNHKYSNEKQTILEKTAEVNEQLNSQNISIKILPGQEVTLNGEFLQDDEAGKIMPLAQTRYCLVELPSGSVPHYTERLFYEMQVKGYIPVLAHPERNREIMQRPEKLYQLVQNGIVTQITAGSLCGHFGKNIKRFTQQLIEANLTHFIASDAHHVTTRPFYITQALEFLEKHYGFDQVVYYRENATLLIEGKMVYKEIPKPIKKGKLWRIFG